MSFLIRKQQKLFFTKQKINVIKVVIKMLLNTLCLQTSLIQFQIGVNLFEDSVWRNFLNDVFCQHILPVRQDGILCIEMLYRY